MACCILAALLLAQIMATVRRWGMFWGLVRVPEDSTFDTAFDVARRWLARPSVRIAVAAAIAIEAVAFGGWLYLEHGSHLYRIGDQAIGQLRGQTIVYTEVCGSGGARTVRLVVSGRDPAGRAATRATLS